MSYNYAMDEKETPENEEACRIKRCCWFRTAALININIRDSFYSATEKEEMMFT